MFQTTDDQSGYAAARVRAYEALERSCNSSNHPTAAVESTKLNECFAHSNSLAHQLNKLPRYRILPLVIEAIKK